MSASSRRTLLAAALLFALAPRGAARASDEGEALFQEGRAALRQARHEEALALFERSWRVDPALGTLLNIAVCEEKLQRLLRARAHLGEALAGAEHDDKRRPLISERIAELERRLPHVTVKAARARKAGVGVTLDGRPLAPAELDARIPIDPGTHALDCFGPGVEHCAHVFTVGEGQDLVQIVDVAALVTPRSGGGAGSATPLLALDAAAAPAASRRTGAKVLAAVGAGLVLAGLVAGGGVLREKSIVSSHCDETGCDPEGLSAADTGNTLSLAATLATVLGLGGLVTSGYLWLTAPPDGR